VINLLHGYIYV